MMRWINRRSPSGGDRDDYDANIDIGNAFGRVVRHVADVDAAAPVVQSPPPNQDTCVICMESFEDVAGREGADDKRLRETVCGHAFCSPCLTKWLGDNVACPVCKRDLTADGGLSLRDDVGQRSDEADLVALILGLGIDAGIRGIDGADRRLDSAALSGLGLRSRRISVFTHPPAARSPAGGNGIAAGAAMPQPLSSLSLRPQSLLSQPQQRTQAPSRPPPVTALGMDTAALQAMAFDMMAPDSRAYETLALDALEYEARALEARAFESLVTEALLAEAIATSRRPSSASSSSSSSSSFSSRPADRSAQNHSARQGATPSAPRSSYALSSAPQMSAASSRQSAQWGEPGDPRHMEDAEYHFREMARIIHSCIRL